MPKATTSTLFPELERLVRESGLLENATGILAVRLPRVLGRGRTAADGLELPPAEIERKREVLTLTLPPDVGNDAGVQREVEAARQSVHEHDGKMRHPENQRRFALEVLHNLAEKKSGINNNQFFSGQLVFVPEKGGKSWSWSMTPHYPVISNIPTDVNYAKQAYQASVNIVEKWMMPVDTFVDRLNLAWDIARHFSMDTNVLIADVAKFFKISAQGDRFWRGPARRTFSDVPEAVFIANLINWKRDRAAAASAEFELVPATLNQAHGPKSRVFYVPRNSEGTSVQPMIHIRRVRKEHGD